MAEEWRFGGGVRCRLLRGLIVHFDLCEIPKVLHSHIACRFTFSLYSCKVFSNLY